MKKQNENLAVQPTKLKQPEKKKGSGLMGRIIRRFFLVLFTVVIMAVSALVMVDRCAGRTAHQGRATLLLPVPETLAVHCGSLYQRAYLSEVCEWAVHQAHGFPNPRTT